MRLLIMALAAARVGQLAGTDAITQPIRDRLPGPILAGVECPFCITVWATALVLVAEHHAPVLVDGAAVALLAGGILYAVRRVIDP